MTKTASASSNLYSGSHVLRLQGSFVTPDTGECKFRLNSETSGISALYTSKTIFDFEDCPEGPNARAWTATPVFVQKDFCYKMSLYTSDHYYYVTISISGGLAGTGFLAGNVIGTCYQSGCRDLAVFRNDNCLRGISNLPWPGQGSAAREQAVDWREWRSLKLAARIDWHFRANLGSCRRSSLTHPHRERRRLGK